VWHTGAQAIAYHDPAKELHTPLSCLPFCSWYKSFRNPNHHWLNCYLFNPTGSGVVVSADNIRLCEGRHNLAHDSEDQDETIKEGHLSAFCEKRQMKRVLLMSH
jgi:hypothetical protein